MLIHGDGTDPYPGAYSKGCIVCPKTTREKMWRSGDRDLKVIAESIALIRISVVILYYRLHNVRARVEIDMLCITCSVASD